MSTTTIDNRPFFCTYCSFWARRLFSRVCVCVWSTDTQTTSLMTAGWFDDVARAAIYSQNVLDLSSRTGVVQPRARIHKTPRPPNQPHESPNDHHRPIFSRGVCVCMFIMCVCEWRTNQRYDKIGTFLFVISQTFWFIFAGALNWRETHSRHSTLSTLWNPLLKRRSAVL